MKVYKLIFTFLFLLILLLHCSNTNIYVNRENSLVEIFDDCIQITFFEPQFYKEQISIGTNLRKAEIVLQNIGLEYRQKKKYWYSDKQKLAVQFFADYNDVIYKILIKRLAIGGVITKLIQ